MTNTAAAKPRKKAEQAARAEQERLLQEMQERAPTSFEQSAQSDSECDIYNKPSDESIDARHDNILRDDILDEVISSRANDTTAEDCVLEITHAPCIGSLPAPKKQHDTEYEDDGPQSASVSAITRGYQESAILNGSVITYCFGCLRVDVMQYGTQELPAYVRDGVKSLLQPVAMILCGMCRKVRHDSLSSQTLDEKNATSWSLLRLQPEMFEGSPAMRTIQHLLGGDVSILTANGGILYRDVDRIVQDLTPDDHMASIDVAAFRRGQRDHPKLPYLRGGLAASR